MSQFINIHTHKKHNTDVLEIINSNIINDKNYFSIGIHPWNINKINIDYANITKLITKKNVLAIGEIGIDRTINVDIDLQKDVFYKQLTIARENNKPVIIHCARAYSDFQQILKQIPHIYIFHGFNANILTASDLIKKGAYLSFGESLIKNTKLQHTFKCIDINKVFFETDNRNININDIYIFASKLLDIDLNKLKNIISLNFKNVFNINE